MCKLKACQILVNAIYAIGVLIVFVLLIISILGSDAIVNPEAMLPSTQKELASSWLAIGVLPMFLACAGAYSVNGIGKSKRKKLNTFLIFAPGIICALYAAGVCIIWLIGLVNMLI